VIAGDEHARAREAGESLERDAEGVQSRRDVAGDDEYVGMRSLDRGREVGQEFAVQGSVVDMQISDQ
jgi:hypothetical protein